MTGGVPLWRGAAADHAGSARPRALPERCCPRSSSAYLDFRASGGYGHARLGGWLARSLGVWEVRVASSPEARVLIERLMTAAPLLPELADLMGQLSTQLRD